jgi:hypothetical protein
VGIVFVPKPNNLLFLEKSEALSEPAEVSGYKCSVQRPWNMKRIAVCGFDCAECEGYLATQANDEVAKERVSAKWRKEHNNPRIDATYVTCSGCLSERLGGHCSVCDIRACGVAHEIPNCAHCLDYGTCGKLARFLDFVPKARANLDSIRSL